MSLLCVDAVQAYVTFGQGFSSKWGDDPDFGSGAVVAWGYMLDGTAADPSLPDYGGLAGTSQLSELRGSIDATYGMGAFDTAIQNAFNTWSSVANITFVGPIVDSGLPSGQQGVTTPSIRIGAFHAVPNSGFSFAGAIGYGPPGIVTPANDFPESGDIFFNLDSVFQIATGFEDVTELPEFSGNDVENLFLHELGHAAIGLGHPDWVDEDPDQRVMYVTRYDHPEWPPCCETINHALHPDDIAAAEYVYGIRGDFNRDGTVDASDYTVWRDSLGQEITSGTGADGNVDGVVDVGDYDLWKAHFGDVALVGFGEQPSMFDAAASVPEASSLAMFALSAITLGARARARSIRAGTLTRD